MYQWWPPQAHFFVWSFQSVNNKTFLRGAVMNFKVFYWKTCSGCCKTLMWWYKVKVKLESFFGLTLSLYSIIWCHIKWHHSLLNLSPINVFLPWYFLCPWDKGFMEKWKISDILCTVCPNFLVYAVLLSDRWCHYKISWLTYRALTRLCQHQSVYKRHHRSARAWVETDQFNPLQLFHLCSIWT